MSIKAIRTRLSRSDVRSIVVFLLTASAVYGVVLVSDKVIPNIDLKTHYRWLTQFHAALSEGTLYPRWMPLMNLGLGELHYSAYPFYYYLASLTMFIGLDPWASMKGLALLSNFLSGVIVYFALQKLADARSAVIGALAIQVAPFPFFLFTHHAALPWQFSQPIAIGLVFLSFARTSRARSLLLALVTALLVVSHVLVAFMTLLCLALVFLIEILLNRRPLADFLEWALPVGIGIGLVALHLLPAMSAQELFDATTKQDPLYLNWRNSFAFSMITASKWGIRWFTVQWIIPSVALFGVAAGLYALWRMRGTRSLLWSATASICLFSVLGLFLASEFAYPLYAFIEPLQSLQWPYRFVTIASLGSTLTIGLAIALCKAGKSNSAACGGLAWLGIGVSFLFLVALNIQLIREGRAPDLSPSLLQGEFHQFGLEFKDIGPMWREYARQGGFDSHCKSRAVVCREDLTANQHRRWIIRSEQSTRLLLPFFAFPGWTVRLDAVELPFTKDPTTGLVAVHIQPGEHVLDIELTGLPQARTGLALSLMSLIGLGVLFFRRARQK